MIDRILTGWNFQRVLFLMAGALMVVISIMDHQWAGALIGSYFAAMGLFAFGCAGGHCAGGSCERDPGEESMPKMK